MRTILGLASMLVLAACNLGANAEEGQSEGGGTTQRNYDVGNFGGITLAGAQNVIVTVGGPVSVRAEGDAEMLDRMEVKVENGMLWLGAKKGVNWDLGSRTQGRVTVYVTTPRLSSAALAGSGNLRVDKAEGDRFEGSIAGSGNLRVDDLRVEQADFSIAGSGNIHAAGSAARTKVSIAGSGDVNVRRIQARQADITIMGSGNVRANATETASVSMMGSGDVEVTGGARCTVEKGGSGKVRCG